MQNCVRVVVLCMLWLSVGAEPARSFEAGTSNAAAGAAVAPTTFHSYYIEFRAARIGTYGHSYVVYGKLNARSEPADYHYTDRHPVGNYALMALGHVVPVPANTRWDPDVLKLPISSSYRHKLTLAQYRNLLKAVKRAESDKSPTWNAIANNCNHYVAELARAAGLQAPINLQLSWEFVPTLRELNGSAASKEPTRKRAAVN